MAGPSTRQAPEIAGFEYLRELGGGGFSQVYLYQQKLPRRQVAIKVLRVDSLDRQARKQFVAEANLMAQLSSHPAIATIYSAGITDDDQPYFVMEFCSGGSLGLGYRTAPLPVAEVLRIGVRVASALESAHRVGIIHRDVKPANILITDYGTPVLTDFGISIGDDGVAEATMFHGDPATATTIAGSGSQGLSIPWAPPEALDDEPSSDERSDIYSLGATLYTLLEGRSPFEIPGASNGAAQLLRRIEKGEPQALSAEVPESLRAAIALSMARLPADRLQTALALAESLQGVERELGLATTPLEVRSVAEEAVEVEILPKPSQAEMQTVLRTKARVPEETAPREPAKQLDVAPHDDEIVERPLPKTPELVARLRKRTRRQIIIAVGVVVVLIIAGLVASVRPTTEVLTADVPRACIIYSDIAPNWDATHGAAFEQAFERAGFPSTIRRNTEGTAEDFLVIAEDLLQDGCGVMIFFNTDPDADLAASAAVKVGVPTIAYGAEVAGADYYVGWDYEAVGALEGQMIIDGLAAAGQEPSTASVVYVGGAPDDEPARLLREGASAIMESAGISPAFDARGSWDPEIAETEFDQAYTALAGDVDAVWAADDIIAAAVISVLDRNGRTLPISGLGATTPGLQNVLLGKQVATVYLPFGPETDAVASLAVRLLRGERVSDALPLLNGVRYQALRPTLIGPRSVKSVVEDGYVAADELCTEAVAPACEAYGIG